MIRLDHVTKTFVAKGVETAVARNVTLVIPDRTAVALLGRNGAGKSSLLRMIGGTLRPDRGRIRCDGSISWPVGFAGGFHPDLTGLQNIRFIARIHGVDTEALEDFVRTFAELGQHFHLPVRHYSSGMRARLGFAASMGIDFDTYLIDEVTSVGDTAFRRRCEDTLAERMRTASAIVVSHNADMLRRLCTAAIVLEDGRAHWHDDLATAIAQHEANMAATRRPPVPA